MDLREFQREEFMSAEQLSGGSDTLDPNIDVYADFVPTETDLDAAYAQRDLDIQLARGDINVMTATTKELAEDISRRISHIDARIAKLGQPSPWITDNEAGQIVPGTGYQQRRAQPHMIIGHVDEDNRRWVPKLFRNISIGGLRRKREEVISKLTPDQETREALNDLSLIHI